MIPPASLPSDVYVDTSVLASALIAGVAHHASCVTFCERLVANDCHVYFSHLLRLEMAQTLQNFAVRNSGAQLPEAVRQRFDLARWSASVEVRWNWLQYGLGRLDHLLGRFARTVELPVHARLWHASIEIMARWRLGSNDALHVATAQAYGLDYLATADRGFRYVSTPGIWLIRDDSAGQAGSSS